MSKNKKNGIPDRWTDYQAVGKRIPGTRFVSFKVPLKQSLCRRVPPHEMFGHWELLTALEEDGQELGLIIDLTFTTRYYRPEDIPDSLFYMKIFTAGHEVPNDPTILSFKRAVRRFLRDNSDNDKLVGVHCTHGLNRTGYLVCRYLIDVDGMDPKEAVDLFNSSRGHSIERQNYLEDLQSGRKRSNEGMEEPEQEPTRGLAGFRPEDIPLDYAPPYERRPHADNNRNRSVPLHQRGMNHQSYPGHPRGPHFPPPLPPYGMWPPQNQYQWRPPHPENEWRRPSRHPENEWRGHQWEDERRRAFHPEEDRHRRSPRTEEWRPSSHHEERWRPHYPPAPPLYPVIPPYTPVWTNDRRDDTSSHPSDEQDIVRRKPRHRHRHKH